MYGERGPFLTSTEARVRLKPRMYRFRRGTVILREAKEVFFSGNLRSLGLLGLGMKPLIFVFQRFNLERT